MTQRRSDDTTTRQQQLRIQAMSLRVRRNLRTLDDVLPGRPGRVLRDSNKVTGPTVLKQQFPVRPIVGLLLGVGVGLLLFRKRNSKLVHLGAVAATHLLPLMLDAQRTRYPDS